MKLTKSTNLLLILLFFGSIVFSQSKRVADRYFEEYSFMRAAELYKSLVIKRGDSSRHVLSRLADSYYNNANTTEALVWYQLLVNKHKDIGNKHLFRYAQALKSNGYHKKSDAVFSSITQQINKEGGQASEDASMLDFSITDDKRIGVRNLAINTPYSEFGGFMLNGNVYFSSSSPTSNKKQKLYQWNNQPFLNIYEATGSIETVKDSPKDTVLKLYDKTLLPYPITTKYHEGRPVFTKDGKTMYFTRNNFDGKRLKRDKKRSINLKIYKVSLVNGFWINVTELPFNSDEYSSGHPALSPDEKTLYFVSNMPGGYGGSDMYKVSIVGETYGEPINLGEKINTENNERFPFVGEDNTLYFSSDGYLGNGLLDIYQTKILSDGSYSSIKNLEAPFNSNKDDFAFFVDKEGKKGFFSSNREHGKGDDDIYSFYIYTDVCERELSGRALNARSSKGVADAIIKLVDSQGEVIDETLTNGKGYYSFKKVPCGLDYVLKASKLDFKPDQKKFVIKKESHDIVKNDFKLAPLIVGNQIVINPIYFDYNKYEIREDAEYELENIVTVMKNHTKMVIKIESHTDSRGNDQYNKTLSDRRAKATRDYIISRGIEKERIESAIGYGEERLLNDCSNQNIQKCTEEEHQKNRRSYFYIVKGIKDVSIKQKQEKIKIRKRVNRRKRKEKTVI